MTSKTTMLTQAGELVKPSLGRVHQPDTRGLGGRHIAPPGSCWHVWIPYDESSLTASREHDHNSPARARQDWPALIYLVTDLDGNL